MAGPSLGTLLIQRLDAALGTTLSQQTQIVNRATSNPVPHAGQTVRPEPVSNTLVRDGRTNVDRATLGSRPGAQVSQQPDISGPSTSERAPGRGVTTSATTSLGPAARIILNLFANPMTSTPPVLAREPLLTTAPQAPARMPATSTAPPSGSVPTPSAGGVPDVAGSPTDSAATLSQALARALSSSLQQSGLFYEAHLRTMLSGQYRLADIRQEPQAQIATSALRSEPGPIPGIDPLSHNIVRQQLEALADQSIHWRGEAWPGTAMEWHIRRQPEREDAPAPRTGDEPAWQSQITLQLPSLGAITMDVRLAGSQVDVRLQTREDTAVLLQQHAGQLRGQMTDRQLELTAMTFVQPDPQASAPFMSGSHGEDTHATTTPKQDDRAAEPRPDSEDIQ